MTDFKNRLLSASISKQYLPEDQREEFYHIYAFLKKKEEEKSIDIALDDEVYLRGVLFWLAESERRWLDRINACFRHIDRQKLLAEMAQRKLELWLLLFLALSETLGVIRSPKNDKITRFELIIPQT